MSRYEVKFNKTQDAYESLFRNGQVQFCPFNSQDKTCGTWCPKFIVNKLNNDRKEVILNCPNRMCFVTGQ